MCCRCPSGCGGAAVACVSSRHGHDFANRPALLALLPPALPQLYGISLRLARDIYQTLDRFLTQHAPEVVFKVRLRLLLLLLAWLVISSPGCDERVGLEAD